MFTDTALVLVQIVLAILVLVVNAVLAGVYYRWLRATDTMQTNKPVCDVLCTRICPIFMVLVYVGAYVGTVGILFVTTVRTPTEWGVINVVFLACHLVSALLSIYLLTNQQVFRGSELILKYARTISHVVMIMCITVWFVLLLVDINKVASEILEFVGISILILVLLVLNVVGSCYIAK